MKLSIEGPGLALCDFRSTDPRQVQELSIIEEFSDRVSEKRLSRQAETSGRLKSKARSKERARNAIQSLNKGRLLKQFDDEMRRIKAQEEKGKAAKQRKARKFGGGKAAKGSLRLETDDWNIDQKFEELFFDSQMIDFDKELGADG